jgi:TEA/ATTS domain
MCPTQSSSPSARFVNWPQVDMSSTDSGYNEQSFTYVCMSTVDDLSYTPSAEERTRDAAQIAATGRRSWKTLKGKGEAVWPPHLEAALIEGKLLSSDIPDSSILAIHLALEKYQPDDSRSTKLFGRFPLRNRFISNYIFETTGKRRTPKQVGSRLQQLRDTCKGKRRKFRYSPSMKVSHPSLFLGSIGFDF